MNENQSAKQTILVQRFEENGIDSFTIRIGDRYQDRLCWDEAIGLLARILVNERFDPMTWLRTKEEHEAFWARINQTPQPLEPWQKLLTEGEQRTQ